MPRVATVVTGKNFTEFLNEDEIPFVLAKVYKPPKGDYRLTYIETNDGKLEKKFNLKIKASVVKTYVNANKNTSMINLYDMYSQPEFINTLNSMINQFVFNEKDTIFDGVKIKNKKVSNMMTEPENDFGTPIIIHNDKYNNYTMNIEYNKKTDITYDDNINEELLEEDRNVLPSNADVIINARLDRLSVNVKTGKWSAKLVANNINCIGINEKSNSYDASNISGLSPEEFDANNLVFMKPETNSYNGKYMKVKYNNGKESALSFNLKDANCYYNSRENDDGNRSYSIGITIDEETAKKFTEFDNAVAEHMFNNQKEVFGKKKYSNREIFDGVLKETVNYNEERDAYSLWIKVYATKSDDDTVSFGDERFFAKSDEEDKYVAMSSEDVVNRMFNAKNSLNCNIQFYLRYIWMGNQISPSWYLGKVQSSPEEDVTHDASDFNDEPAKDVEEEDEFADTTYVNSADESTDEEED